MPVLQMWTPKVQEDELINLPQIAQLGEEEVELKPSAQ